jgi:N-acetylneuraminate synthase
LPVRYHDHRQLLEQSNPDFLEFHLSYKDLEVDPETVFEAELEIGFAVHSPDLFSGDHLLNLASEDDEHRARSVAELQRVIDLTRRLNRWFPLADTPVVIASLGGFTKEAHVAREARTAMYERVADSLARLDVSDVRLCAQTLPPFPWYLGGQLFCNLFVEAADTAWFAETFGWRLCLDVSHTKLAANFAGESFLTVVDMLAPYTDHLHIVDASGVDGEGLQIGEGEIDFTQLARQLNDLAPNAGFIPEIWQGHVNNGEGFWLALERLEKYL